LLLEVLSPEIKACQAQVIRACDLEIILVPLNQYR
jgi:hypothetical protein